MGLSVSKQINHVRRGYSRSFRGANYARSMLDKELWRDFRVSGQDNIFRHYIITRLSIKGIVYLSPEHCSYRSKIRTERELYVSAAKKAKDLRY